MDEDLLIDTMVELSVRAGDEILKHFDPAGVQATRKLDGSPVTAADTAADDIILSGLAGVYPDVPTISEERLDTHVAETERCFIVDPLDGTSGFSRGETEFTVNIGYVVEGVPQRGVVYVPADGRLFFNATDGTVTEKRRMPGSEEFETVSANPARDRRENRPITVMASWTSSKNERLEEFLKPYGETSMRFVSSSLKFCLVANGEADLYPRFGRTMEWDTAAGHALVNASGGQVVRLDDFRPLTYGKHDHENPFFVACGPGVELRWE